MTEDSEGSASPTELLSHLMGEVALLAAPATEQEKWLDQHGLPIVELALQYYDSLETFAPRLGDHGLIDEQDRMHMYALEEYLVAIPGYQDDFEWLRSAPEWVEIRQLAAVALAGLERHKS